MHNVKNRHFVSLVKVVEQLASSNFSGAQEDVDRKEALDDVLAALRNGAVRARGVKWETNGTGRRWAANTASNPERITPAQWCDFEYRPDENELHQEDWDATRRAYRAIWLADIEVDCATAEQAWPGRVSAKYAGRHLDRN